jgi:outer membrane protein OmpA-like peptidoglycan-associated protein/LysM repeat protein/tetratricopeptide (TPR) repeat protein
MNTFYKILLLLFLSNTLTFAQKITIADEKFNQHKQAGDKYFQDEEYYLASQEYLKAAKIKANDPYIDYQLANCYRINKDFDDAEFWYQKAVNQHSEKYPLALYYLGDMQKTNGKYLEAEKTFQQFIKTFKPKTKEDELILEEAKFEYEGCVYALEELKKPIKNVNFSLLPPPVNSKNTDFAPVVFDHDSIIIITSSRADAKGKEMNLATGEARFDNFRFEKQGEKWVRSGNADNFDIINTKFDDGAGEMTRDKQKYYYTICDPECAIYVSKKENGKFTKPVKLNKNINPVNTWNAQPTLSPTADTMFFDSKRPGGKGQNDIWMSINRDKTGKTEDWGPAINMVKINTPYQEISPFWDDHTNTIYFASDGHVGFGGWDIYMAAGRNRDSIVNIGLPFNSSRDDFYFTLGKEKGYLVSNRKGGIGLNDIYWFDINAKEAVVGEIVKEEYLDAESISSVGVIIFNDTQLPVANIGVSLRNEKGEVIKETKTNANGEFKFQNLDPSQNFKITIDANDPRIEAKVDYKVEKKKVLASSEEGKKLSQSGQSNEYKRAPETKIEEKVAEKEPLAKPEPIAKAEPIAKPRPEPKKEIIENTMPKTVTKENAVSGNNSSVSVTNFQVKKSNLKPSRVFFENVYFDFNSNELSKAGEKVLQDILKYYSNHKNIQIEIKAYTDGYGDAAYNKQLAEQRAQACYDYLIGRGVDQTAIVNIPIGNKKPVGNNNSFIGRQLNRRVEFSIIGGTEKYEPTAMAYVIEPRLTLYSIAKMFGMTVDELKELNGITESDIKAYSVIRVRRPPNADIIAPQTLNALKNGISEFKFKNMEFIPIGSPAPAGSSARESLENDDEDYYIVQPKETLYSIAKRNNMTVEQLQLLNGLTDNNLLVGQRLKIKM